MPTLTIFIQIVLEVLTTAIREEKNKKESKLARRKRKISLFADDILYIENLGCHQKMTRTHQ